MIMYELQHAKAGGGQPLRVKISAQNTSSWMDPGCVKRSKSWGSVVEAGARRQKTRHTEWGLMLREGAKLGLQARISQCEAED
jgi:hypothetical protein